MKNESEIRNRWAQISINECVVKTETSGASCKSQTYM